MSYTKELFPGQLSIPTGRVALAEHNSGTWSQPGVWAVGMGRKEIIASQDDAKLKQLTQSALELTHRVRKSA